MARRSERGFPGDSPEFIRRRFMIAGDRTILRALERDDLVRCYEWMNDPAIVKTLKSRYPMPFHTEAEWLESAVAGSPTARHFAIERKEDRAHIGNASIHDIDWVSRTAAFGLFIGEPSSWNQGYGSDAVRGLMRFAFEEMNLRKLRIKVFAYNEKAKHVLSSAGFQQEGRLEREYFREGTYHDILIFSVFSDAGE